MNERKHTDVLKILNTLEMIDYTIKREISAKAREAWNLECTLIGMKNDLSMIKQVKDKELREKKKYKYYDKRKM